MSKRNNFYGSKSGLTARTIAFLAATGITDATISAALNTMDLALIANGLDTKMNALYPFVGGTATTHKYNFMNPTDTDAAFRLTFAGGWTHSATGALPNGSTGYADTHLIPASALTVRDTAFGYYSRTNTYAGLKSMMGCADTFAENPLITLHPRRVGDLAVSDQYSYASNRISAANSDSQGFYISSRTTSTSFKLYKNGAQIGSTNVTLEANNSMPSVRSLLLAAYTNSAVQQHGDYECALAFISSGLSDTDASNYYTLVQAFQNSLSRNV